jgi:hypothetical protein
MSEIDFYTSEELVTELSSRGTFAGIIFRSIKEVKGEFSTNQKWDITYCKMSAQQTCELLEEAVEHFRKLAETEPNE